MTRQLGVCPLDEFVPDTAQRFDVDGHRLAVVRIADDGYVIGDRCSHAGYSLAEGEVDSDDRTIECWKHGSAFSLETGEPGTLSATRSVPTYDVKIEDGDVIVLVDGGNS